MKTSRLLVVGLLLSVAMGCGGGGDSKRTDLSCAPNAPHTDQACESGHSDIPAVMRCVSGWHSVASCSELNVLATCTLEDGPFSAVLYVYDDTVLGDFEAMCNAASGYWEEYIPM